LSSIVSVSDDLIEWGKFDLANTGLLNQVNNLHMQNSIFRNSQCGFCSSNVDSTFCSNLLCESITNESEAGIYYNQVSNGLIEKNVVIECENGTKIKTYSNPEVKNNYITNCGLAMESSYYSHPNIHNNCLINCEISIYIKCFSSPTITKNIIGSRIGIQTFKIVEVIEIHYNNLNCNDYSIKLLLNEYIHGDVNAENNYFYTINNEEIQELIYDKNDVEISLQIYMGEVFYIPFLTQKCLYAGIQEY